MAQLKVYDRNMLGGPAPDREGIVFYNIDDEPFRIYGVWREGEYYARIPKTVAESVSEGIGAEYHTTAGGRVRFVTDSPYVAVSVELDGLYTFVGMSKIGTCGMDIYADGEFVTSYRNFVGEAEDRISSLAAMRQDGEHLIEINFPLYCNVKNMYVGIDKNASLKSAPDYTVETPVVFYGSSITHGACSSRPGLTYPARLSRMLDMNFHSLGYGGLCKGEVNMANYIASLNMSACVLDYDHNAPTPEYLRETHSRFFNIVREKNPDLPILILTCPRYTMNERWIVRRDIIKETYDAAVARGDKNVYILYGSEFFSEIGNEYSVDDTHPTDEGFYYMARAIAPTLRKMLEK